MPALGDQNGELRKTMTPVLSPADFRPMLRRLDAVPEAGGPSVKLPPPVDRAPATSWPQLDVAAAKLERLFLPRQDAIGTLKLIGRAHLTEEGDIVTSGPPWNFQAWLPFAPSRVAKHKGAFVEVDVEVYNGEIGVAVLSDDGSHFVGDRYTAAIGSHHMQLPILSNAVRGVMFCNGEAGEASRFKILRATIFSLDATGEPAGFLRDLLAAENAAPPPEVTTPDAVEPSPQLVLFHLLAKGKFLAVRCLLHAIEHCLGQPPDWFPPRLQELLDAYHGSRVEEPPPLRSPDQTLATDRPPGPGTPPPMRRGLREMHVLRDVLRGADLVPLHLELLEFGFGLDLIGVAQERTVRFNWQRQALASTPVARGLMQAFMAVVVGRLRSSRTELEATIITTPTGTRLTLRSTLGDGDLQYREFNDLSNTLHAALNRVHCVLPVIEHRLGQEDQLSLYWPDDLEPATRSTLEWSSPPATGVLTYYRGSDGGEIRLAEDRCYKMAPDPTAKPNDLVAEYKVLDQAWTCDFVPQTITAHAMPDGSAMSYCWEEGVALSDWAVNQPHPLEQIRIIHQLSDIVARLNELGVLHRDLRAENVLIRPDGSLAVLDFDQSRLDSQADDFGNEWAEGGVCSSFGGLLSQLGWEEVYLRSVGRVSLAWKLGRLSAANSPGKHACYYAWRWGAQTLPGERPWALRWRMLKPVLTATSAGRLLELGCNLGLLSTHAALLGWKAHGIDHDGVAVAAADLIASAVGSGATFERGDLADPAFVESLETGYDMVTALSIVHWLENPDPVEAFLAKQSRLLFEGHRALDEEIEYLRRLGFNQVCLQGYTERLRPLLLATK